MGAFTRIKELIAGGDYFYFDDNDGEKKLYFTFGIDKEIATFPGDFIKSNPNLFPSDLSTETERVVVDNFDNFSPFLKIVTSQFLRRGGKLYRVDLDFIDYSQNEYELFISNKNAIVLYKEFTEVDNLDQFTASIYRKLNNNDVLNDIEIEFYNSISSELTDKSKKEIRVGIVKQSGDSTFIANEFGIENFFDLERFTDIINEKIINHIDDKINTNYDLLLNSYNNPNLKAEENPFLSNLLQIKVSSDGFLIDPIDTITNDEEIFIPVGKTNTPPALKLVDIAGTLPSSYKPSGKDGRKKVPFADIKNSELYNNPTSYDKMEFYNRFDNTITYELKYPEYLKDYYKPQERQTGLFSWFSNSTDYISGIDDIILGQWLYFISTIEEDVENDGSLTDNIGSVFNKRIDEIYLYIFNWIVIYRENAIRYNLAKLVADMSVEDLMKEKSEDALNIAEAAADLNLQGMEGDLGDDDLSEEDIQQRTQLYKQCVLLLNLKELKNDLNAITVSKFDTSNSMHSNDYYNNRFYMVESSDDNLTIKNKLISPSGSKIKPFMEITPDIASALKTRLRLYKIYKDKNGKTTSFEFPFSSYIDSDRVRAFDGKEIDRGDGVGIKSFNFSFDGETPATSQKYISADMTLFFQTFSDFVKLRNAPNANSEGNDEQFRYADLFVNTKYCPQDLSSTSPLNYDPTFYRLRVDVGWEPREDDAFKQILKNRGLSPREFNDALMDMNKSFYLNLVDHDINISESGTVSISANYIAYIEGLMDSNNVLLSAEAKQLQDEFVNKYEELVKNKNCQPEELAEVKASITAIRISSRRILHQSLVEKLVKNKCMYYSQVRSKDRKEFTRNKFFSKKPKLNNKNLIAYQATTAQNSNTNVLALAQSLASGGSTTENYNLIMDSFLTNPKQNNMERISFFYMADLVYFLLDPLYVDGDPEEQVKIILSSFSINIPYTGDVSVNIGQIPIEIEVFTKWYKDEIIDKELDSISFLEFIKRLTFYLITDIFSEVCVDESQHKRMSFMNAAINSIKDGTRGLMEEILVVSDNPVMDLNTFYSDGILPLQTSTMNQDLLKPTDFVQYLLIYPHHRPETHVGRARALDDARRGVHHLYIGADRGILKNASFSKTDIQYLRESRMLTQGENGLLQLSSLYRVNLKMIGNTIFYPGMLLYLNPFGFGGMDFGLPHQGPGTTEEPNLSNIMGIGGYQKVVKVSSTISDSGKFETNVECIFEHTGEAPKIDSGKDERSPGQRTGRGQQDIRKITCADLDSADGSDADCPASSVSKDLQNKLLQMNRKGTIDKAGAE